MDKKYKKQLIEEVKAIYHKFVNDLDWIAQNEDISREIKTFASQLKKKKVIKSSGIKKRKRKKDSPLFIITDDQERLQEIDLSEGVRTQSNQYYQQ